VNKKAQVQIGVVAGILGIIAAMLSIGQFFGIIDSPVGETTLSILGIQEKGTDVFDTEAEALERGEMLGCDGTHTHKDKYMPCYSHEEWRALT